MGYFIKHLRRSGAEKDSSQLFASHLFSSLLCGSYAIFSKANSGVVILLRIYIPRISAPQCSLTQGRLISGVSVVDEEEKG